MKLWRRPRERRSWRRRIGLSVVAATILLALLAVYVAVPVAGRLNSAAGVLSAPAAELDDGDLAEVREDLLAARSRLDGIAAKMLGVVPIAGQNLAAARSVTDAAIPAVEAESRIRDEIVAVVEAFLVSGGQVDTAAIGSVADELRLLA